MRHAHTALVLLVGVLFLGLVVGSGREIFPPPKTLIHGQVVDERGPVPGARVRVQGQPQFVRTDAAGRFRLPAGPGRVTAAKPGYFIAGASQTDTQLTLRLARLPGEDHEDYAWVDPSPDPTRPGQCGNCHPAIHREWAASGHARAVTGRHFQDLYNDLVAGHPDGAGVCASCHAPTARAAHPEFLDLRRAQDATLRGVHCDYCHKVADAEETQPGLTHGRYGLRLLRPAHDQLFFGPLDDVDRGEDAYAPVYRESRYCASCHEGVVFGVPAYTTYSEWLASPARRRGRQCQTCHMAPTGERNNLAPGRGGIRRDPSTLANHRFFAGNQQDMLRRCLSASVQATPSEGGVSVSVTVTAEDVGHRVPTGFPDRNLTLVVEGWDAAGRPRAAAGPRLPAFATPQGDKPAGRLYAKLLRDFDGRGPVSFWRAAPEVTDTRLEPGQPDRSAYTFPPDTARVRARLIYRRFWPDTATRQGWPGQEWVVREEAVVVRRGP